MTGRLGDMQLSSRLRCNYTYRSFFELELSARASRNLPWLISAHSTTSCRLRQTKKVLLVFLPVSTCLHSSGSNMMQTSTRSARSSKKLSPRSSPCLGFFLILFYRSSAAAAALRQRWRKASMVEKRQGLSSALISAI